MFSDKPQLTLFQLTNVSLVQLDICSWHLSQFLRHHQGDFAVPSLACALYKCPECLWVPPAHTPAINHNKQGVYED